MTYFAYRKLIAKTVVVNTKTGRSFRGVLWARRGPLLVLRAASLLEGNNTMSVDGEVVVALDNVDFIQVLTEVA